MIPVDLCRSPSPPVDFLISAFSLFPLPTNYTMAVTMCRALPLKGQKILPYRSICLPRRYSSSQASHTWATHQSGSDVANDHVARLAASPRRPLTLADLLK